MTEHWVRHDGGYWTEARWAPRTPAVRRLRAVGALVALVAITAAATAGAWAILAGVL